MKNTACTSWETEFDAIWGGWPDSKQFDTQGMDARLKAFISEKIENSRLAALEEIRGKVAEKMVERADKHDHSGADKCLACGINDYNQAIEEVLFLLSPEVK